METVVILWSEAADAEGRFVIMGYLLEPRVFLAILAEEKAAYGELLSLDPELLRLIHRIKRGQTTVGGRDEDARIVRRGDGPSIWVEPACKERVESLGSAVAAIDHR